MPLGHSILTKNTCISELETLGLVWAVRYFRPYLLGHHTVVFTDHSACLSLLNTPRPSGKLARWAMTVQEMNLTLKHRSGRQNANADALSRNPLLEEAEGIDSVRSCEELECSSDNMCSVGVVKSVAHSILPIDQTNKNNLSEKKMLTNLLIMSLTLVIMQL